jgi:hypothetical protein
LVTSFKKLAIIVLKNPPEPKMWEVQHTNNASPLTG